MSQRRLAAGAAVVVALSSALALTACATTIDPDVTTVASGDAAQTTVFVATGSTTALLDQLVVEATGLSEAITENEGQRSTMERIDALWEVARTGVDAKAPDMLADFDRAVALMRNGVDRRRPADADKALNNFRSLAAAFPADDAAGVAPRSRW